MIYPKLYVSIRIIGKHIETILTVLDLHGACEVKENRKQVNVLKS